MCAATNSKTCYYFVFLQFISQYHNMIILSAPISVDTFFMLSGLLVSINMLKHFEKTWDLTKFDYISLHYIQDNSICFPSIFRKGRMNVPMLYLHRYLRLTPLLAITILSTVSLLRFMGNGPLWPMMFNFISKQCESNWWSTILYVQNYVHPNNMVSFSNKCD